MSLCRRCRWTCWTGTPLASARVVTVCRSEWAVILLPISASFTRPFTTSDWGWSGFIQTMHDTRFYDARVNVSQTKLAGEMLDVVESKQANVVCISALPPAAATHARYLCKRLRPRFGELPLVIGLWNSAGDLKRSQRRIACDGPFQLVVKLADALTQIDAPAH